MGTKELQEWVEERGKGMWPKHNLHSTQPSTEASPTKKCPGWLWCWVWCRGLSGGHAEHNYIAPLGTILGACIAARRSPISDVLLR